MKRNGIIYPNTPYFKKFAGKLRMPCGVDGANGYLLDIAGGAGGYALFLKTEAESIETYIDGLVCESQIEYSGIIDAETAQIIAVEFGLYGLEGLCFYFISLEIETLSIGNHTVMVVADGVSYSAALEVAADYLTFTSQNTGFSVGLKTIGIEGINIEYSTDGESWQQYTVGNMLTVAIGETIRFRGNNASMATGFQYYSNFVIYPTISGAKVDCMGDPTCLLNGVGGMTELPDYAFLKLFIYCSALQSLPSLSKIKKIGQYSCFSMFEQCTGALYDVTLHATEIGRSGCQAMYSGCTGLNSISSLESVNVFGQNATQVMYNGCTGLSTVETCVINYDGGESANHAHQYMFKGCSNLLIGANITIKELGEYMLHGVYDGCSNLREVRIITESQAPGNNLTDWLNNVYSSGVVKCPSTLVLPENSANGIPSGWTRENI